MSTIRDVAKLAQVSVATVSRVLNNDLTYKMKDETRGRVWKAVTELGYKPRHTQASGRPAAKKDSIKIGCILSVTKDKYKDPYFMSILSGVEEAFSKKGYTLAFLHTYYELQDWALLHNTFHSAIDGLILMESLDMGLYEYIRARVPYCVGMDTKHRDIDNIGYDHFEVACNAVCHLIQKGHTDIAFIGGSGPSGNIAESQRYCGYYATMLNAGLSIRPEWIKNCQWDETLCVKQIQEIMHGKKKPTAIFAASDLMAIAALSSLYSMNIVVPNQVAVIGLSNIESSQFSSPPLTTFEIPTREIGITVVDVLEKRLLGNKLLPQKIYLPVRLIQRESV